ncbi:Son of sevenless 1, partial [Sarracenia purpurea var. burkii]
LAFPYDWSWKTSLLLGGLLSATDPVAVVALLKDLGASKKLSTIIEGESLMNDG